MFIDKYNLERNLLMHMQQTSKYTELLAQFMNFDKVDIEEMKKGAMLHDIGKKRIPEKILNKKEKLSIEEFETIKQHPKLGIKELHQIDMSMVVVNIILYHHEKWNGQGYPSGLIGNEIPIEARIVSIADCYNALLTSTRPYKRAFTHEEALEVLRDESGKSFDPYIVAIFEVFEDKFK
ncbi:MAG: HD domain-containing protein [Cetobacterium sp.]